MPCTRRLLSSTFLKTESWGCMFTRFCLQEGVLGHNRVRVDAANASCPWDVRPVRQPLTAVWLGRWLRHGAEGRSWAELLMCCCADGQPAGYRHPRVAPESCTGGLGGGAHLPLGSAEDQPAGGCSGLAGWPAGLLGAWLLLCRAEEGVNGGGCAGWLAGWRAGLAGMYIMGHGAEDGNGLGLTGLLACLLTCLAACDQTCLASVCMRSGLHACRGMVVWG